MSAVHLRDAPRLVMVAAAALLFVDLFLKWQQVTSSTGMLVERMARGWHGWGAFVGILIIVLFLRGLLRLLGARTGVVVDLLIALAVLSFTIARIRDQGEATIGLTRLDVGATLWPAWAGLGLALMLVAAALALCVQSVSAHLHLRIPRLHAPPAA